MHLLFDLDGTLTDSFLGISRCINHALAELGRNSVPEPQFRGFVGAPLAAIFGQLLASDDGALLDRAACTTSTTCGRARFRMGDSSMPSWTRT